MVKLSGRTDKPLPFLHMPADFASRIQWQKIGATRHHGIALPLLALRNPQGSAIGEYLDLIPMIEWCKSIGFDVIQLLPLNDSGTDASPYSALSAMALHPIYISLWALPHLEKHTDLQELLNPLRTCNCSQRVAYNPVRRNKDKWLRLYFDLVFNEIQQEEAYQKFIQENPWVQGYALFKALKENNDQKAWFQWDQELQNPSNELLSSLYQTYHQDIDFYSMLQYLAFDQWSQVKKKADENSVFLKGDIPILINRDSADVWLNRECFMLDYAAGAPPDMYSEEGQYWGFPLYNWDWLKSHNYSWWKQRLHVAEKLYHIFRIDHIVGFFRIWAIPEGKKAKEGFFIPSEQSKWIPQGEEILKIMLSSSSMLPIGEDLGVVPDEVRQCMTNLGIPGTKVIRWERRWKTDRSYIPVSEFNPLSMTTISTHDSETITQWWDAKGEDAQVYARMKGWDINHPLTFDMRLKILQESHSSNSLFHINLLQEYLSLFPELIWPNPDDERINIPGIVKDENWTYRFRPTIYQITHHVSLARVMHSLSHVHTS